MTDLVPDTDGQVALYVHWPYCARICPYCDFNVVRDRGRAVEQTQLVDAIVRDIEAQAERIGSRKLASVFFGGGTPSLMAPEAVARVLETATGLFAPIADMEVSLEANPTDAEAGRYAALAEAGVTRLSMGIQSFDDAALKFLGRDHSAGSARRAAQTAARIFPRLSIDLIYARPDQTIADWKVELGTAFDLGFEHISPYQLTIESTTAFGRAFARGQLVPPDEDMAIALYETTQEVLEGAGFEAYEISNHARTVAARSRHNLHVWRGGDYIGAGPGAHGRLITDQGRAATVSHRKISDYIEGVAQNRPWAEHQLMDACDADEERVLLGLRTVEGVPLSVLSRLGLSANDGPLSDMLSEGFLQYEGGRIRATREGRPVLDSILKRLLT
ncbi:radical SAM family heme chaperone HemW [Brevundimonas sp.]|uniref:radical SAM family heme chaperone HemW n=1 Tax=Brevundimonas sp. TaxID=1871086 RepID=UPI00289DE9E4|nr:radical SAM family heme chaperone HemW [Brevundimonas sp.]